MSVTTVHCGGKEWYKKTVKKERGDLSGAEGLSDIPAL
jgi:hypothetical protein